MQYRGQQYFASLRSYRMKTQPLSSPGSKFQCIVSVRKTMSRCSHVVDIACHTDLSSTSFKCSEPCTVDLGCGPRCEGTCGGCNVRKTNDGPITVQHRQCSKICGRRYHTCDRLCPRECHDNDCGLCYRNCEVSTSHSFLLHSLAIA